MNLQINVMRWIIRIIIGLGVLSFVIGLYTLETTWFTNASLLCLPGALAAYYFSWKYDKVVKIRGPRVIKIEEGDE